MAETVFKVYALVYAECELSFLRACRKVDISWDGLQFLYIILYWTQLKRMRYSSSEHTERVMLAEAVFDFYALAYAGGCSKV